MSDSEPSGPTSHRAPVEPVPLARRLLAPLAAVAVVIVVIVLLIVINGHNPKSPSTAGGTALATPPLGSSSPTPTTPTSTPPAPPKRKHHHPAASVVSPKPRHHSATPRSSAPASTAMAAVTVLNNSRIRGLAHHVAGEVGARGWQIAQVGNLPGLVPQTTVYFAPGDEAAAAHLAAEFGQIQRIEPDSEGRLHQPGITLVATRFWTG